jgi:hypothetical protein
MIAFSIYFSFYRLFNYSSWNGKMWMCTAVFCIGIGMIVSKTPREALAVNKVAVMGYAIDNNLLDCHGWKSVKGNLYKIRPVII